MFYIVYFVRILVLAMLQIYLLIRYLSCKFCSLEDFNFDKMYPSLPLPFAF